MQLIKDSLKFHYFSHIPFELLETDMGPDANNINEPLKVIFRCFENVENFISNTSHHIDI